MIAKFSKSLVFSICALPICYSQDILDVTISEARLGTINGLVEYPAIVSPTISFDTYPVNTRYLFDLKKKTLLFYSNERLMEKIPITETYELNGYMVIKIVSKDIRNPKEKLSSTYMVNLNKESKAPSFLYYWFYDDINLSYIEISSKLDLVWREK